MIKSILKLTSISITYTGISFFNALVELYVAIRSIMTAIWWMVNFCTVEYTVEDEDGTIIHHFPQLNDPWS
jgi:hypothetical protein